MDCGRYKNFPVVATSFSDIVLTDHEVIQEPMTEFIFKKYAFRNTLETSSLKANDYISVSKKYVIAKNIEAKLHCLNKN